MTKNSVSLRTLGTVPHMIAVCGKMVISPAIFFHLFRILILGVFKGGVKGQKMTHNYQFQSVTLHISRTVDLITKIFDTQV